MSRPRVPFLKQGHSQAQQLSMGSSFQHGCRAKGSVTLGSWKGCMEPRKENKEHKLCPEGRGIKLKTR